MKKRVFQAARRSRLWLLGWALWPVLGWSQVSSVEADAAVWRQANDLVGRFRRGHADWLKWELTQSAPVASESRPAAGSAWDLRTPEAGGELAWQARPKLAGTLNRLGDANRTLVLTGRWTELDPRLSWRLDGLDEVLDVAVQVRKAWLQAAASQMALVPMRTALDAAQLAQELGQRMVAVGNWSPQALAPHQLAWANAQINWQRAQYAAERDREHLLKLLGQPGRHGAVQWPGALPALAAQAMDNAEFERQLQRILTELPMARRAKHRALAQLAFQACRASHAVASVTQNGIVKTREQMAEDTQLQYNGMLKSTWDLLAEVQNLAQARVAGLEAQRDFAIAEIDLNWTLFGGEPDSLIALAGTIPDAAPAGH